MDHGTSSSVCFCLCACLESPSLFGFAFKRSSLAWTSSLVRSSPLEKKALSSHLWSWCRVYTQTCWLSCRRLCQQTVTASRSRETFHELKEECGKHGGSLVKELGSCGFASSQICDWVKGRRRLRMLLRKQTPLA